LNLTFNSAVVGLDETVIRLIPIITQIL